MSHRLYHKHIIPASDRMYRYALSILREPETARDVVQDSLTKIWNIRNELSKIEKINAWTLRMVRNRCLEIIRRNRYTDLDDKIIHMQVERTPDRQTVNNDRISWLSEVLATLPPKQREVFHLREVEELSYREIAKTCDLTESDVKVNIHRARKKVKETMLKIEAYGIAN